MGVATHKSLQAVADFSNDGMAFQELCISSSYTFLDLALHERKLLLAGKAENETDAHYAC
jgi:hypothetical protein